MVAINDINGIDETEAHLVKQAFGEVVRHRREKAGFDQRPFSRIVGISNSHLRAIESGQVSPTVVTICKICSVLECDTSQLFMELDDILKAKRARQRGNH